MRVSLLARGLQLVTLCVLTGLAHAQKSPSGASATSAVYVRTDSDHTTVVSPRIHVAAPVDSATRVDLVYSADVWSSASIDIRSAASKRVVEQRDELDVALEHALSDVTLGAGYRYSIEHDYESHGGSLGASIDLAQHATQLASTLRASIDRVGKAGDPLFDRRAAALGGRFSLMQIIDPRMFVQLVYEATWQQGYLASPYRYVRIADDRGPMPGTCVYPSTSCERENNPNERLRHAWAVNLRRAFGDALSLGGHYRFYQDSWRLRSHSVAFDVAWMPGRGWLLALEYRFYRQSAASHYQAFYRLDPFPTLRTSDKELSPLNAHRLGFELSHTWQLDAPGSELTAVLSVAPSYFTYDDVAWLRQIRAFESTLALELAL
jgi:hypothetical protein